MSAKKLSHSVRTWITISSRAVRANIHAFRKLIGPKVRLWAVVKSNAYGHGLSLFSRLASRHGIDGFCVDSIVEGIRLREDGITKPILVVGYTLPVHFAEAKKRDITVAISTFEGLRAIAKIGSRAPRFHIKVDTGMHRQGFQFDDIVRVIKTISNDKFLISKIEGIFTHFATAKDITYPAYTERQFEEFQKMRSLFEQAGFKKLMCHTSATGGTLFNKKYHLDAVRIGIGMYGVWPSQELETELSDMRLSPVLSWYSLIGEIKNLKRGDYVGYDITERLTRPTRVAVIPVGYWHGFSRSLSSAGDILVKGKRARVLGRVSMDMISVDVTGILCHVGDKVTIIGKDKKEEITVQEFARRAGRSPYEVVTCINPLIARDIIG
jgi:alanine racemase